MLVKGASGVNTNYITYEYPSWDPEKNVFIYFYKNGPEYIVRNFISNIQ